MRPLACGMTRRKFQAPRISFETSVGGTRFPKGEKMSDELKPLNRRNQKRQQQLSQEFCETLAQELALTAETLNFELTELAVAGYREALSDMTPEQLRRGFKRARRALNWFPKPAEVRECAYEEWKDTQPVQQ